MARRHFARGTRCALLLVTLCVPILAAGRAAAAGTGADRNVAPSTPPIHIRQEGWTVLNGKPTVKEDYAHLLMLCRNSGKSVTPLKADVVAKLGRSFYDIRFVGAKISIHSVSWGWTTGPGYADACHFRAIRNEREAIARADGTFSINLDEGTAEHDPTYRVTRTIVPITTDAERAQDVAAQATTATELKQMGFGGLVAEGQSKGTPSLVAGQPCLRISDPIAGTACIWSGGAHWGFATDGPAPLDGYISGYDPDLTNVNRVLLPGDTLALSIAPTGDLGGTRLVTREMTIGQPPPPATFRLPPNLSVKTAGR